MMTVKEMVDLGFTDEQIKALLNGGAKPNEESAEDVNEDVNEDGANDEGSEDASNANQNTSNAQEFDVDAFTNTFDDMLKRMNKSVDAFTKKVQNFNINNAQIKEGEEKSIDDIFEEIILPKGD